MTKKVVVVLKDAVTGVLAGGKVTYRVPIDEESSDAQDFSLLVNTSNAGKKGARHKHDVEHCWYILSGKETIYIGGQAFEIEPKMAIYAPPNVLHKLDVNPEKEITYVVVYTLPGPEQKLKRKGVHIFDSPQLWMCRNG